jgi:hypothetical protein
MQASVLLAGVLLCTPPLQHSKMSAFLHMGKDINVFSVDSVEHDTEITVTLI